MYHLRQFLILLISSLIFSACKDDDSEVLPDLKITKNINNLISIDVSNNTSSEDIYIEFSIESDPDEIRIVLIPLIASIKLTRDQVLNLEEGNYTKILPNGKRNFKLQLDNTNDINGERIKNNIDYAIKLILIESADFFVSDESSEIVLKDQHPLIGKYTGTWSDNIHNNADISLTIDAFSEGKLTGTFFHSANFESCCRGAENDGTITLEVSNEQMLISDYKYDQIYVSFKGAECNGSYSGSGKYEFLTLDIDYSGQDCYGVHLNGNIKASRFLEKSI